MDQPHREPEAAAAPAPEDAAQNAAPEAAAPQPTYLVQVQGTSATGLFLRLCLIGVVVMLAAKGLTAGCGLLELCFYSNLLDQTLTLLSGSFDGIAGALRFLAFGASTS